MKKVIFGYTPILNENVNFGLLLVRLFAGFSLAFAHGIGKLPPSDGFIGAISELGFPVPGFFAWMSGIAEFFGGLFLAMGLAARPAALLIGINMGVAAFLMHADDPFSGKEKALLFFIIALLVFITGAGKYSVDKIIHRN
ncbi:MAG: DoxX family protein [Cyclobacteriaceae bacterium]|nr:DoxX family protein [Cyclobacteriaceae bacterium]